MSNTHGHLYNLLLCPQKGSYPTCTINSSLIYNLIVDEEEGRFNTPSPTNTTTHSKNLAQGQFLPEVIETLK